ncbi:MAG: phosphatidylglycerophosphatase A [Planctomycetota bacterium]
MRARDRAAFLAVTFGGAGLAPVAPGTAGSFAALMVALLIDSLGGLSGPSRAPIYLGLALAASVLNVALGPWIKAHFGSDDPSPVVIDEVAGQWLALAAPVVSDPPWILYAGAFVLFRLFDIWKPLGCRRLEALPGGWGILLDDLLAGVYVALLLWVAGALGGLSWATTP